MCYVSAVTATAADFYGLAAKTTLLFQYDLLPFLHYLVTCPQTGIPCLPACKMTAYKMIHLHSLHFFKKIPVQNMFNLMYSCKAASSYQMN